MSPQSQTSGLTVRQHEREGIALPMEFVVSAAHGAQVRFSTSSSAGSAQSFRGLAIDISSGGMGLKCRQFVPRMCEGTVRVYMPAGPTDPDAEFSVAAASDQEILLEQRVKVRRVTLIGRQPMYSLGVAFIELSADLDQQITALFGRISTNEPTVAGVAAFKANSAGQSTINGGGRA